MKDGGRQIGALLVGDDDVLMIVEVGRKETYKSKDCREGNMAVEIAYAIEFEEVRIESSFDGDGRYLGKSGNLDGFGGGIYHEGGNGNVLLV